MSREYDYTPHSKVDEHYHIRELFDQQDKRVADRQYHRDRVKDLEEREEEIKKAEGVMVKDFWCDTCKKDFKGQAVKQVEIDWSNPAQRIAFYKTKCFCGKWAIRLITDRHMDRYFEKSRLVARDRGNYHTDILQSFESGYNLVNTKK